MDLSKTIAIISAFAIIAGMGSGVNAQNAMYQRCEPSVDCAIGEFIFADDGHTPITADNYCQITITNPGDSVIVNGTNMGDKNDGWYYYNANIASPTGLYRASMCCDTGAARQCIDKTFILGTTLDTVASKTDIAGIAAGVWSYGSRTLDSFGNLIGDIWAAPTRRLTDKTLSGGGNLATESYLSSDKTELLAAIGGNATLIRGLNNVAAADVWNVLSNSLLTAGSIGNQMASNMDSSISSRSSQISVDAIRTSQQKQWTVYLSDTADISKGETYRAKLFVLNNESTLADLPTRPTVTIYDPVRNKIVEDGAMTKLSTGVYEYTYNVASSAVQGQWETEASATIENGQIIKSNDYWNVAGSPAQVIINSIGDSTIPGVSANVTITNEGATGYEYHYEWCVVSSADNACGGNDDVFYSSAAKFIQPGEDWVTNLSATVPAAGNYWFKIMVYFGNDESGASQSFTAAAESNAGSGGGGGGSSSGGASIFKNIENSLTSVGQLICNQNTFPCNIILKILARLDQGEKNDDAMKNSIANLSASVNQLLNAAPRQVVVRSAPVIKKPAAPTAAAPAIKRKANVRLDI